jgi:hypothetical protein
LLKLKKLAFERLATPAAIFIPSAAARNFFPETR